MTTRKEIINIIRKNLPYLKNEYSVKKIALFGSFASGKANQRSDIDIFIDFSEPVGLRFMELAEYLEKILHKKADVITSVGLKTIRVKGIAREIKRRLIYV